MLPTIDGLGVPQVLKEVVMSKRGLTILVGATGSGKIDHAGRHGGLAQRAVLRPHHHD